MLPMIKFCWDFQSGGMLHLRSSTLFWRAMIFQVKPLFFSLHLAEVDLKKTCSLWWLAVLMRQLRNVISKSALETLQKHNISVTYNMLVEAICNRDNTGYCPIETAVFRIISPDKALIAIRNRLNEMKES